MASGERGDLQTFRARQAPWNFLADLLTVGWVRECSEGPSPQLQFTPPTARVLLWKSSCLRGRQIQETGTFQHIAFVPGSIRSSLFFAYE